jgi:hypothetical protein
MEQYVVMTFLTWVKLFSLNAIARDKISTKIMLPVSKYNVTRVKQIFDSIELCLRDRDRMVVGFTTTYAISAYHH